MQRSLLLIIFLTALCHHSFGQIDSSNSKLTQWQEKERKFIVLPLVYYTPETRWAFGAAGLGFFRFNKDDTLSPLSTTGLSFAYTNNDQILFQIPFNLYFSQNKYRIKGDVSFYRYPYFYAGIGNDNPEDYKENYSASFPRLRVVFLERFGKQFFTGPSIFTQNTTIDKTEVGGALESGQIPGSQGGVASALGWEFQLDQRDNVYAALKGHFLRFEMLFFEEAFLSDFNFNHFSLDLRKYFNLGKNHVIAIQGFGQSNFGNTPFNRMAQLGGPKLMRGYKLGAFRDQHYTSAQVEYRTPFWKAFGLVGFVGAGAVSDKISDFNVDYLKPSYGAGLRVAFNKEERIHLRIDYARGDNRDEFYFTVAESF